MFDAGYAMGPVSKPMGHATVETARRFYADCQVRNAPDRILRMKSDRRSQNIAG